MKTLYVCGDSFVTPSKKTPGKHFSEIVSKTLGYELKTLAHGGMSNAGICLQIEKALVSNPSFVIVTTTYTSRFEIPFIKKGAPYDYDDLLRGYTSFVTYDNKNKKMVTDSFTMLEEMKNERMQYFSAEDNNIETNKKLRAGFNYYVDLYDPYWKEQTDCWNLYAAFHKLHVSNIPYLIVLDRLNFAKKFSWVTEKHNILPYQDILTWVHQTLAKPYLDPGYHTPGEGQIYMADKILTHIDKFNILS